MTTTTVTETTLFTQDDIARTLKRLAHEILEANQGCEDIVLVGLYTRGTVLAKRLQALITQFEGKTLPLNFLDITLYRDDSQQRLRETQQSQMATDINGKRVILIDDVLFSGRTIRAALNALNDYGRPASVQLLVLLDRGHRELPISPDFVGKNVPTAKSERVNVRLSDTDGNEQVTLSKA